MLMVPVPWIFPAAQEVGSSEINELELDEPVSNAATAELVTSIVGRGSRPPKKVRWIRLTTTSTAPSEPANRPAARLGG